ncbi:lysosomal acid glucosylceramidase-like [Danaus plexippus]|nr:lysosomal acid glucosylceramidase-like [Danaus plexippus]
MIYIEWIPHIIQFVLRKMGFQKMYTIIVIAIWLCLALEATADMPCNARDVGIQGRSVLCVCNATYCDTITRDAPARGRFVSYTSSKAGKRFQKGGGPIQIDFSKSQKSANKVHVNEDFLDKIQPKFLDSASYTLISEIQYQSIEGFGGSVTDAASINWQKLSPGAQDHFVNSYFSKNGLEYNLIRTPIGGADFSTYPYTYNEYPINDYNLSNFSLSEEDYKLKLPLIKRGQAVSTSEIKVTASTWSPPVWMKTNNAITGFAQVKPEFYQSYADYHLRFIEEYDKENVTVWAITTTNEPINGMIPFVDFNSLGWFPWDLGRWVANNLGPTIKSSKYNKTLILAVDEQRYLLDLYLEGMLAAAPKAIDYIDGIAVHYYGNFFPAQVLTNLQERYPGKIILATEACEGPMPWDVMRVKIGSWERADRYTKHIIDDLNNFVVGWLDWNLCLDEDGGPNWAHNYVDSPILVNGEKDEFYKQPMFYAMGHFSKFIPRGSKRIQVVRTSIGHVENVAFITPERNVVMVLHNPNNSVRRVRITVAWRRYIDVTLDPESIQTVEVNLN